MIGDIFVSLATMVTFIIVAMEMVDKVWHLDGLPAQIRTIVFGGVAGLVGGYFELGMFSDPNVCIYNWYTCGLSIGLASGIVACWSFALDTVKAVLELLKIRPKKNGG